jgi:TP901 family phage tail tape measure protein
MSRTVATILTLNDRMSGGLLRVSRNVNGLTREAQRANTQTNNMATKFTKNLTKMTDKIVKATAKFALFGAIAGAGIIVKIGIDGLKELDEASAKVKSIAKGDLEKRDIKTGLIKASNKTGVGVAELGNTQYEAISSGVSSKDSLEASIQSAKLAKAGFTDSNSALKVLMGTMNVYGLSGVNAMKSISDKLLVTQNLGVVTVAEMAESMGSVTPIAQAAGASIDELMGGFISLTKNGIKADEATTELKGMFTSIIAPTKESADMAKSLGLEFNATALKSKGFAKFMADVKAKTGGSTEKMAGLFGNVRALTGALVLSGAGFDDFNEGLLALKDGTGATDEAFAVMSNTIGAKWDKVKNRFKNTCTTIVDTQSGTLGKVADGVGKWLVDNETNIQKWVDNVGKMIEKIFGYFKKVVDFLIEHRTAIENFAIVFASFYIAVKAVSALSVAINICKVAWLLFNGTLVLSPFGWLVLAIAAVIAIGVLLWKNWDVVKEKADTFCFGLKNAFSNIGTFVGNIFKGMANTFIDAVNLMIGLVNKLPGVKIGLVDKFDMGTYASLTRPEGNSASRSYDAQATRLQTSATGTTIKNAHKALAQNALGTPYFNGGATKINERGGEIAIMPSGSKIIPADKTDRLLSSKSDIKVYVTIQGNIIGNEEYADYVGNHIVDKVQLAVANM